ncbi:eukaryotic translation initiation factor 4E type 3-like [Rhopilema esculentum]|uniref:eukaryotic translation initiation factor 4E type 3-like n=1 Tax=Rhopilema esculentum TaxID=499914 RepID=UPI0031D735AF
MVDAAESSNFQQSSAIAIPQRTKLIEEDGEDLKHVSASPNLNNASHNVIKSKESDGTPLNSPWTFWFDRYQRDCTAAQYEANLRKLYTVTTIEGFWGVYNNIPDVGKIGLASYHLMRGERRPIWEDDCNVRGGYWKMRCSKDKTSSLWKELLLAIIGEKLSSFVHSEDEIVGVSVSIRDRDDIIQVWNQDAKYSEQARVIEAIYDLDQELTLHNSFYKAHCDHSAFESGSKRPGQQQGGPRKYEGFSHTPPSYGSSPRQSFGGTRDFAPQRYGSSPRQVFGGARDAASI